jgi:hypothetical protein
MFRIGITVYLAVATLAGRSLCCCTMDRAFDSALGAMSGLYSKLSPGKPASNSHCCCASKCSQDSKTDGTGKQSPHNPDKCPCKEKSESRHSMPSMDRVEVSPNSLCFELAAHFASPAFALQLAPVFAPVVHEQGITTRLSGQEILLAFQTFRC